MATSPAPDAGPAMCPGIAVLGGGAGGGGGSGSGNGNGGAGGGDGSGDGDGAGGDGKGASGTKGCGKGKTGCGHPSHSRSGGGVSKGEPVDVATGAVFTEPVEDLYLPGPLPLSFERFYRSNQCSRDIGLGPGWSHSFSWSIRRGRKFLNITKPDGTVVEVSRIEPGQATIGGTGLLIIAKPFGFILDIGRNKIVFHPVAERSEIFRPTAIIDPFGNHIALSYEGQKLTALTDSVDRQVRLRYDAQGKLERLEVMNAEQRGRWVTFARYDYDLQGRLIGVLDAIGARTSFDYDSYHRLTKQVTPNGVQIIYRYDARDRCVSTWAEAEDLGLASTVSDMLDLTTKAKGIHHCEFVYGEDYTEVLDSSRLDRYYVDSSGAVVKVVNGSVLHQREHDEQGHLTAYTDPTGATTKIERDFMGRPLRVTDPLGAVTTFERNPDGSLARVVEPNGAERSITYGPGMIHWRDPIGAEFTVHTSERGMITATIAPNGSKTEHRFDHHCNETETIGRYGQISKRTFDHFGRCTSSTDASGASTHYRYNLRGDLLGITDPLGHQTHYSYDGDGNLIEVRDPEGRITRMRYAQFGNLVELQRADGSMIQLRYDRDGLLVEVVNAAGELHHIKRNLHGLPVEELTFDGRSLRYGYELNGLLRWVESGAGERTEYEHDLCGRLTARRFHDGSEDRFTYDLMGDLLQADSGEVVVELERNAVGWVTRQLQRFDGQEHKVELEYDLMGKVILRRSSLGHEERIERDEYGHPLVVEFGRGQRITRQWDELGREVSTVLPQGGRLETSYDPLGRMIQRRVIHSSLVAPVLPSEQPAWVGPSSPSTTSEQWYQYNAVSELVQVFDQHYGREWIRHDAIGQLLSVVPEHARGRLFGYDAAGDMYEQDDQDEPRWRPRRYGPGGRLLEMGDRKYEHDGDGRVVRMDSPEGTTHYLWGGNGLLTGVKRPDGAQVRFSYDALDRRIGLRITSGEGDMLEEAHFVWDQDELLHDLRIEAQQSGDPIVEERSYGIDEDCGAPWAHHLKRGDEQRWHFAVRDHRGAAIHHVDAKGDVIAHDRPGVWGELHPSSTSPFGLPGQYRDESTGLHYSRFRYYDPEAGRYLSPDPIGLAGGAALYAYARNSPVCYVDPLGLMPETVIYDAYGNEIAKGKSASELSGGMEVKHDKVTNTAIENATRYVDTDGNRVLDEGRKAGPCAEAMALSNLEKKIRKPGMSDAEVKAEMRRLMKGGRMETRDDKGRLMAPCSRCARMIDRMGLDTSMVVAPKEAAREDGRWNGVTTQSKQTNLFKDRPDDRAETAAMHDQGAAYQSPAERGAAQREEQKARNKAVYDRQKQHEAKGWSSRDAKELAEGEYDAGEIDPDGNKR